MLGAFLLLRRAMLDEIGGWDAGYRMYCEDIDLNYRAAKAGWERWYVPAAVVHHEYAAVIDKRFLTRHTLWHARAMLRFLRKHPERLLRAMTRWDKYAGTARRLERRGVRGLRTLSRAPRRARCARSVRRSRRVTSCSTSPAATAASRTSSGAALHRRRRERGDGRRRHAIAGATSCRRI